MGTKRKSGPHVLHRLTDMKVQKIKTPGAYADGGGLYLQVAKTGAKSWLFRFMLNGRAREMGLGPLHTVPLAGRARTPLDAKRDLTPAQAENYKADEDKWIAGARDKAQRCRELLERGIDPIEHRKIALGQAKIEINNAKTFDACAAEFIASKRTEWTNPKHAEQWTSTLKRYISPQFGSLPVQLVDVDFVYRALTKDNLWTQKTETATRVRQRIEAILDWATVSGFRMGDNPARWAGMLEHKLPNPSKFKNVENFASLPYPKTNAFIVKLREETTVAARALEFLILTAVRTNPIRFATWDEIDFDEKAWNIPDSHMKAKVDHRVPLCDRAIEILKEMEPYRNEEQSFIFPGGNNGKAGKPMSENGMLDLLDRINASSVWVDAKTGRNITPHGFRSTFRDWAAELTNYPSEVVEMALAHTIKSKVEAAYRRGDLFEKRRQIMADWERYCETEKSGKVISARAKVNV